MALPAACAANLSDREIEAIVYRSCSPISQVSSEVNISPRHSNSCDSAVLASPSAGSEARRPWACPVARRQCAKQVNMRLMNARTISDIFQIVIECAPHCDSINTTAAFQRLAKLLEGRASPERRQALESPVFSLLVQLMTEQCARGSFNPQSTANAWWAVSKLFGQGGSGRPGSSFELGSGVGGHVQDGSSRAPSALHTALQHLLEALEGALASCLTSRASEEGRGHHAAPAAQAKPHLHQRPNAQAISSTWYAWGRLASLRLPSAPVRAALWERSWELAWELDAQGVANVLWAWGQLRRRHGDAFGVRCDVLAAVSELARRMPGAFAVQGLSCAALGAANLGPGLLGSVGPLLRALAAEATRRAQQFNLQAMANLAAAVARGGAELRAEEGTRRLMEAFDVRASRLSVHQPLRGQEASSLAAAMGRCGHAARAPGLAALQRARGGSGGRGGGEDPGTPAAGSGQMTLDAAAPRFDAPRLAHYACRVDEASSSLRCCLEGVEGTPGSLALHSPFSRPCFSPPLPSIGLPKTLCLSPGGPLSAAASPLFGDAASLSWDRPWLSSSGEATPLGPGVFLPTMEGVWDAGEAAARGGFATLASCAQPGGVLPRDWASGLGAWGQGEP